MEIGNARKSAITPLETAHVRLSEKPRATYIGEKQKNAVFELCATEVLTYALLLTTGRNEHTTHSRSPHFGTPVAQSPHVSRET